MLMLSMSKWAKLKFHVTQGRVTHACDPSIQFHSVTALKQQAENETIGR